MPKDRVREWLQNHAGNCLLFALLPIGGENCEIKASISDLCEDLGWSRTGVATALRQAKAAGVNIYYNEREAWWDPNDMEWSVVNSIARNVVLK